MKKSLKISIPKPCHQDWSKMTVNQKGRFCNLCVKTVIDFTQKSVPEIQEFLLESRHKKVCGHFYKKQLDAITLEIPEAVLYQQLSFSKLFLLVLLITMGTTLLSCNSSNGKKQKIDNVVLIDSINRMKKEIEPSKIATKNDSAIREIPTIKKIIGEIPPPPEIHEVITNGIIEMGDVKEGILQKKPVEIKDIEEVVKEEEDDEIVFGFIQESPPSFIKDKEGSIGELKKSFSDSLSKFVTANFDIEKAKDLGLDKGKHKIWAQFTISEEGNIINLRARASHKELENQAIEILKKLPQLVPGKQRGEPVVVKYTLPIIFEVE